MKTIGDVVKKMKEEGEIDLSILIQKKYVRHGSIFLYLEDLEKVSPSLDIEEYMNEQDEEDIGWSYDWFDQDPTEEVECPLELDGVQIG